MLDSVDIRVLGAIAENPVSSLAVIGKAAGMSPSGLAKRIESLARRKIIPEKFVEAQISYATVGLDLHVVFAETHPKQWSLVEEACNLHPYSTYRVRTTGGMNGFFLTFAVPRGTTASLIKFLDGLRDLGVLDNQSVGIPIAEPNYSEIKTTYYRSPMNWEFDWKSWTKRVPEYSRGLNDPSPPVLHDLGAEDITVLRLLSIDARQEKKAIGAKAGMRDYQLSRRLEFYERNNVIRHYKMIYERNVVGLLNEVILKCKCSQQVTESIAAAIREQPFQSTFFPMPDGFILVMAVPPSTVQTLSTAMQQYCDSVQLVLCDYTSSLRYYFDNEPSNFVSPHQWNSDRGYMLDSVLDKIRVATTAKKDANGLPQSER